MQEQTPDTAAPAVQTQTESDTGSALKWYTLKEAAQILGKSKSAIEYHAGKLDSTDRRTDAGGIIRISAAAVDAIRQKARTSTQQAPNKHGKAITSTQQAPEKYQTSAQEVPESVLYGTQQEPPNRPTSTKQAPNNTAERAALDALQEVIAGLRADLQRAETEKRESMEQAAQFKQDIARLEERERAAQDRAERAEKELDTLKAQNQSLTDQLAAIADKQADAIRAGAAEQLALAIPEQAQEKRGLFARLFHREKKKE